MALRKTHAYLLRFTPFGDTSRIAVLFGREEGVFRVMVKGYRNPKNACARALEPFREIEVVYYHRPDRDLQIASAADVLTYHAGLDEEPARFFYGWAALELCLKLLPEDEPSPAIYDLLQRTLAVLGVVSGARAAFVFRGFQARTCAIQGFLPVLKACAVCDGEVAAERLFSASAGGFVCRSCSASATGVEAISPEASGLFRFLVRAEPEDVARAYSGPVRPAAVEVAQLLERFLAMHVERYQGLRSLSTLGHAMRSAGTRGVDTDRGRDGRQAAGN